MTVRPLAATLRVTDDKDVMVITLWNDGSRTMDWVGFWAACRLVLRLTFSGVKVEVL